MSEQEIGFFEEKFELPIAVTGQEVMDAFRELLTSAPRIRLQEGDGLLIQRAPTHEGVECFTLCQHSPHPGRNLHVYLDGEREIRPTQSYSSCSVRLVDPHGAYVRSVDKTDETHIRAVKQLALLLKVRLVLGILNTSLR